LYRGPLVLLLALSSAPTACGAGPDFDTVIAPLLSEHCLDCHGAKTRKGGLDLSRRAALLAGGKTGKVLSPGKPDESRLWDLVRRDKMPPRKPLNVAQKAALRDWIAAGVPWGTDPIDPFRITTARPAGYDWWALQPLTRRAPPVPREPGQARNPVDAFLLDRLAAHGLGFARSADRRTLIRRLSIDLLGLESHIRREALAGTELARAEAGTIRLRLFKIGAWVQRSVRRVVVRMASSYPWPALFAGAVGRLVRPAAGAASGP
jgi:hypothetical protein